ncbi:MAG TPA: transglycosylase SLT domain-containing protein [Polyangiaceae bacterium]
MKLFSSSARARGAYAALFLMGAVGITCSAQRQRSPAASPRVSAPLDETAPGARAARSRLPKVQELSLEEFMPLLALPELGRVTSAVEQEDFARAGDELEAVLRKSPPSAEDALRFQLVLGRLRERAGDAVRAGAAYERAASRAWALSDYARLAAGRVLVRLGKHRAALARLTPESQSDIVREERRLLVAEAAASSGDLTLAIENWRAHLQKTDLPPQNRMPIALSLSDALLTQAALPAGPAAPAAAASGPNLAKHAAFGVEGDARVLEALSWARRTRAQAIDNPELAERSRTLEQRALELLPPAQRARVALTTPEEELLRGQALHDGKKYEEAEGVARAVLSRLGKAPADTTSACAAGILRAKSLAGMKQWGKAADVLNEHLRFCRFDREELARALFLAGKYAAADGRHALAIQVSEELEKQLPEHRLADDARLRAALSYYELGSEARFTELLTTMPEDYPNGDMVPDGVFGLALRRIEKGDWSGAASVLERAAALVAKNDSVRGHEFSGRERYFRARAYMETGERERGLDELEAIIRDLPLSYYMLHAYSRLVDIDPFRAKQARDAGIALAVKQPFSFTRPREFSAPGFVRAMELLRAGEFDFAHREIAALGLSTSEVAPQVLWGIALLYAKAGSAKLSHAVARGLLSDWLARWPAGDWLRAWELAFPRPYRPSVEAETKKNGIPESLAYAVMREESAFDPDVVSPADAHGLMQLIVPTAREFARPLGLPYDPRSLKRPHVNVALGCRVLGQLTARFKKNPLLAIPAYNAGPGRPVRWLKERPRVDFDVWVELIPFNETRRYTKRVLASRAAYAYLYERETADLSMALPSQLSL